MVFILGGVAILLIAIGGFATYARYSKKRREMELPSLVNKYRNANLRGQRLLEWAMVQEEPVGEWLRDMHDKERKQLLRELDRFCKQKKFDLAWVLDQQVEDKDVQTALNQAVMQFLRAQFSADDSAKDLENYIALIDLLQHAESHRYRNQMQTIYLQLVNQNAIPKGNTELLFSGDSGRWKKGAKSIALASRTHREIVNLAVREHMLGEVPKAEYKSVDESSGTPPA